MAPALSATTHRAADIALGGDPNGVVGVSVNSPSTLTPSTASAYSVPVTGSSAAEPLDVIAVAAFVAELHSKSASGLANDQRQILIQFIRSL